MTTDKQIQEAAERHARKTVKDLPTPSLRSEMTLTEWFGWFKEEFEAGANFVQSQSQWIPVEERLPESGKKVLCVVQRNEITTVEICSFFNGKFALSYYTDYNNVPFWKPLPEPPKAETK